MIKPYRNLPAPYLLKPGVPIGLTITEDEGTTISRSPREKEELAKYPRGGSSKADRSRSQPRSRASNSTTRQRRSSSG